MQEPSSQTNKQAKYLEDHREALDKKTGFIGETTEAGSTGNSKCLRKEKETEPNNRN